MTSTPTRPILRYYGGKWKLAPWIISFFPAHRVYTEAFGGAASVLLRKVPAEVEIYNDLNEDLVNLFRVLRDKELAAELVYQISLTPWAKLEMAGAIEPVDDPVERARRLIVLSFMSVGTDATNRNRSAGFRNYSRVLKRSSVPVQSWLNFPASIAQVVERIQGRVIIENTNALNILRGHDSPVTLHYVDPPYPWETRGDSASYNHEMSQEDHVELASVLRELEGMVILSGYPSKLYDDELFPDWHRVCRDAYAQGASKRIEVLWLNEAAYQKGMPLFNYTQREKR